MNPFDLATYSSERITPEDTKLHLVTHNDDDPIDLYRSGEFEEWQAWQTNRNFQRDYVIALLALPGGNSWLYAGVYRSNGYDERETDNGERYVYDLDRVEECSQFEGRLVVDFERPGRQSYLNTEKYVDDMSVQEIKRDKLSIREFPGFRSVNLRKQDLDEVVAESIDSWRAALSGVAGVYLITDRSTSELYVGIAAGEEGIWGRWCEYAETGHGGNQELKSLLEEEGEGRADDFRFSILEVMGPHETDERVRERESFWRKVLMTRENGLNVN